MNIGVGINGEALLTQGLVGQTNIYASSHGIDGMGLNSFGFVWFVNPWVQVLVAQSTVWTEIYPVD